MQNITFRREVSFLKLLFFFFIGTALSIAQCPTIDQPSQTFCDTDTPTVDDLDATNNGTGVQWYFNQDSTSPLSASTPLISGHVYYADDNNDSCTTREGVTVTIYGPPEGSSFQGVCTNDPNDATIADLELTGNNIQWYTSNLGGTPIPTTTVLTSNEIYYASQTNPETGCETSRRAVLVTVEVAAMPEGDANQTFCDDPLDPPTVADLQAEGGDYWYDSEIAVIPLDPSTELIDGEDYFATRVEPPCESSNRLEVVVTLTDAPNAGTNGTADFCSNDAATDLFASLGGTPEAGGTWSPALASGTGMFDPSVDTAGTYTYTVAGNGNCADATAQVVVTITDAPDAGTNGTADFCSNDAATDLFDSLGGTPEAGGTWSPALASGTGMFDPSVDAAGTYTYTVAGNGNCADATAQVVVSISSPLSAGNAIADLEACETESSIDLSTGLDGTQDMGGEWTNETGDIVSENLDISSYNSGTFIFTYTVDAGACGLDQEDVVLNVIALPNAGSGPVDTVNICTAEGTVDLFDYLSGNPDTNGTWSPALASGTSIFDPTVDDNGTYTYTVAATAPCSQDDVATVTVQTATTSAPTASATQIFCASEEATVADLDVTGNNIQWYADASLSSELNMNQILTSGDYFATQTDNSTGCESDAVLVEVTINDAPTPTITLTNTCEYRNSTVAELTAAIQEDGIIIWYDAAEGGNIISENENIVEDTTYYASIIAENGCESSIRLAVTINFDECEMIRIPEGFSPNGDGINETFYISNIESLYPNYEIEIFNRYGSKVYEGDANTPFWDGTSDESTILGDGVLPTGVYYYVLKFNDGNRKPVQGTVYLNK